MRYVHLMRRGSQLAIVTTIIFIFVSMAIGVFRSPSSRQAQTDKIAFINKDLVIEAAPPNSVVECEFEFYNRTRSAVSVKNVQVSCGCMTVGEVHREVGPSAKGSVRVSVSTRGLTGPNRRRQQALVEFEPSGIPSVPLSITLDIQPYISVNPEFIVFKPGDSSGVDLRVTRGALSRSGFQTLRVQEGRPWYRVEAVSRTEDVIDFRVLPLENLASLKLPELMIYGQNESSKETLLRTVVMSRDGPSVAPSVYLLTLKRDMNARELPSSTQRVFRLNAEEDARITDLEVPTVLQGLLEAKLDPPGGKTFRVWTKEMPTHSLTNETITLKYQSNDGSRFGRISLPIQIMVN